MVPPPLPSLLQADMATKRDEFLMWAAEVKRIDIETLDRYEEKDLFKDFMEDFNTGGRITRGLRIMQMRDRTQLASMACRLVCWCCYGKSSHVEWATVYAQCQHAVMMMHTGTGGVAGCSMCGHCCCASGHLYGASACDV